MEKLYKVCTNKGNKRIWIEGKILINAGLDCGLVFDKTITDDQIVLNFDSSKFTSKFAQHKIAGTQQRPIIDLCGKYLTAFFGNATQYKAAFNGQTITITRGSE